MFKESLTALLEENEDRTIRHLLEMKERGRERELIIDVALVTLAPADPQRHLVLIEIKAVQSPAAKLKGETSNRLLSRSNSVPFMKLINCTFQSNYISTNGSGI